MHKRVFISLCLLLAFAILQAHNFTPHQHTENKSKQHTHHHSTNNHHHDDDAKNEKDDDHQAPFTDLTHNADFGKVIVKQQVEKLIIEKPGFSEGTVFQLYHELASFESTTRPHPPDDNASLHLIFISHSLPLRAPPASSCLS